jgi:hypothetical protein
MARQSKKTASKSSAKKATPKGQYDYCSLPLVPERILSSDVNPDRARLILLLDDKWVNGTILHYYFFDKPTDGESVRLSDGTTQWVPWTTTEAEKNVVRQAFKTWKEVGVGLEFEEVDTRDEAEIRIGFMRGDGAWSYIGRTILEIGRDDRTMNFGWDLTRDADEIDTAIHEIGHTFGFPHEHQNPNAGIVWNEEAVYAALAKPPNSWSREKTFYNIIRKIEPDTVQGSNWDPDSIMHYPFKAGLIDKPEQYRTGLIPAGNLSDRDKVWVKTFYPSLGANDYLPLTPFQSVTFNIGAGEQKNFLVEPQATRNYEFSTFGESDTVMVFFEDVNGKLRYRTADDDSGEDRNASFRVKLFKGKKYVLRIRLYYKDKAGETAVMMW